MITIRTNKRVYCDFKFWQGFFKIGENLNPFSEKDKTEAWLNFLHFLEHNEIVLNISDTDVPLSSQMTDNIDSGFKEINKLRRATGGALIICDPDQYIDIQKTDVDNTVLNSVFLTCLGLDDCKTLSSKYGIFVLNLEMTLDTSLMHLYVDNGEVLSLETKKNWSYLKDFDNMVPSLEWSNSLIIIDPYLLADVEIDKDFPYNLEPILDSLLPRALNKSIKFTITVIVAYDTKGSYAKRSNDERRKVLKDLVSKLRPYLNYNLEILYTKKLHDRAIFTNNVLLSSGAGFGIFFKDYNGRITSKLYQTTTNLTFPFFQRVRVTDEYYLLWIKNSIDIKRYVCDQKSVCENHILEFYNQEQVVFRRWDYQKRKPRIPFNSIIDYKPA